MRDISVMIDDVKVNYRAALMLTNKNNVLVEISPNSDFSMLPGGRVKTKENTKETIVREIEEEMHIKINKEELKLAALIENFFTYNGIKHHEIYVVYKMEIKSKDKRFNIISINYDTSANYYRWVNKNAIKSVNLVPRALKKLMHSNKFEHIIFND